MKKIKICSSIYKKLIEEVKKLSLYITFEYFLFHVTFNPEAKL